MNNSLIFFPVPPAKPEYIKEAEITSTTVMLTWPDPSWQDMREYSYCVFYKLEGEAKFKISASEPYLNSDNDTQFVINMTGLKPRSTYYFKAQSFANTPEEGPLYSDEAFIDVVTKGEPRLEPTILTSIDLQIKFDKSLLLMVNTFELRGRYL